MVFIYQKIFGVIKNIFLGLLAGILACSIIGLSNDFLKPVMPFFYNGYIGAIIGGVFVFISLFYNQIFYSNIHKFFTVLCFSTIICSLLGAISFFLVDQIINTSEYFKTNDIARYILECSKWTFINTIIYLLPSVIKMEPQKFINNILVGLIAGVSFCFFLILYQFLIVNNIVLQIFTLITFGLCNSIAYLIHEAVSKTNWLLFLNGPLAGKEFTLSKNVTSLGSYFKDDIKLDKYVNVTDTHAKIIQYGGPYTILNNDPFMRTWVNFRPFTEHLLRHGDIIRLGDVEIYYISKS